VRYYDEIWIYGLEDVFRPLDGLGLPEHLSRRTTYTGYLRREVPAEPALAHYPALTQQPFILVTTGGGGDGDDVIEWVLSAYEADPGIPLPALFVFGPFINRDRRRQFLERIARQPKLDALAFETKLETLMSRAEAVVGMGGYNTFCEILSFDKRALIVPRTRPRREQLIRAQAAERLGLTSTLVGDGDRDPAVMAAALRALPNRPKPSDTVVPGLLDGLDLIRSRVAAILAGSDRSAFRHAAE
jgi:predicted glycosyltransferase